VVREAGHLARELLQISLGSASVAPAKEDWRFADPTWNENPAYRRIGQAYLSFTGSMDRVVDEVEKPGKDPGKARFAVTLLTSAVAPTNFLLGNPAAIKRTLETGGGNLARGVRNWAGDLRHNGGMPSMADPVPHTPVDLSTITVPTFATGAVTDHLTPWKGCYRTTQLLSGPMTFVLSNSGHIQSLVNPPGNPKASYYTRPAARSRCRPVACGRHQAHRVLVGGLGRLDHPALRRGTARPAVPGKPGLRTDDRGPRRLRPPGTRTVTGSASCFFRGASAWDPTPAPADINCYK
jgi:hypothetical protein